MRGGTTRHRRRNRRCREKTSKSDPKALQTRILLACRYRLTKNDDSMPEDSGFLAGSSATTCLVPPRLCKPGLVATGLVSAGLASAGLVSAGLVSAGLVSAGLAAARNSSAFMARR